MSTYPIFMFSANAPRAATATARANRKRCILCPSLRFLGPAHPNGTGAAGQDPRAFPASGGSPLVEPPEGPSPTPRAVRPITSGGPGLAPRLVRRVMALG